MTTDLELIKQIERALEKGLKAALCTLIEKKGSGPREPGAKMVVFEDGQVFGTIGGGSFERILVREALNTIKQGKPKKVIFSLGMKSSEEAIETGLLCGGEVEVFIDVMEPKPNLYVVGAGHVAEALAKVASILDFNVVVIDDNENLASKDRFPMAKDIIIGNIGEVLETINISQRDFVVIMHGNPEYDFLALKSVIKRRPFYIGLMGSKIKVSRLIERLRAEGASDEDIKSLHAPAGLEIGAQTPEEIALSIVAEMVAKRRRGQAYEKNYLMPKRVEL